MTIELIEDETLKEISRVLNNSNSSLKLGELVFYSEIMSDSPIPQISVIIKKNGRDIKIGDLIFYKNKYNEKK